VNGFSDLDVVLLAWTTDSFSYEGKYYQYRDAGRTRRYKNRIRPSASPVTVLTPSNWQGSVAGASFVVGHCAGATSAARHYYLQYPPGRGGAAGRDEVAIMAPVYVIVDG
jgi:hypothetical protein